MLKPKTRWKVKDQETSQVNKLATGLNIEPLVAKLLLNRNINTVEQANKFLNKSEMSYHDPFLFDDMERVVERVHHAIEHNEKILIFGDYDADGVSSTALLFSVLQSLQAKVEYYIPNRFTEGYGPNEPAIRHAKDEGVDLVITVDTGISANEVAQVAKDIGLDFIITDHHEAPPVLPNAYAIVNPKKPGCSYPFKGLAGVGVALKVAHALLGRFPTEWLDFAVIGTIADLVPLIDENRLLAIEGLHALQVTDKPGLIALKEICGLNSKEVREDHVGFGIGPRINASGRLGSADPAVQLLLASDPGEASLLAAAIDQLNKERQQIVNDITKEAIDAVEELYPTSENHLLVIEGEDWNSGVIGIVASRLVERFHRPAIVLSVDSENGIAKGSARSIEGFDMFQELSKCRDILPHFGGHPMAAGLTMNLADVSILRHRLNEQAKMTLTEEDFKPLTSIDLIAEVNEITVEAISQMERLAPFGMQNPAPKVLLQNVGLGQMRCIGKDNNHLKVNFEQNGCQLEGIGFQLGFLQEELTPLVDVSAVGSLSINEWNGYVKPQIVIEDLGVFDWQLFDWRSVKKQRLQAQLEKIPTEKRILIAFKKETQSSLGLEGYDITVVNEQPLPELDDRYLVLLDVPAQRDQLRKLLSSGTQPSRIYTIFYQESDSFFTTNPSREQFKWYYAFLLKKNSFDLNRYSEDLAKHKGWSAQTINFMSQVFCELGFVSLEKGVVTVHENPEKKGLEESETFRNKQEQALIENEFVYSTYSHLKDWLTEAMALSKNDRDEFIIKETVQNGF